jgi:hypothetical protein
VLWERAWAPSTAVLACHPAGVVFVGKGHEPALPCIAVKAYWSAMAGTVVWVAVLAWIRPDLQTALLLLGPLVATPLVLGLAHPGGPRAHLRGAWRAALLLQLPAAACAAVSFSMAPGLSAAAWTLPWLAFATFLAILALLRFVGHRGWPLREDAIDAGLAFLLVGASWLTIERRGEPFLGYEGPIVFYTAAHFHFAGLVLPVLGGLAARAMPNRLSEAVCAALVVGMPFVAVGIMVEQQQGIPWVNVAAVTWFTAAAVGLILMQAGLAVRPGPAAARLLWGLSAACLPVGMALASLFVYGNAFGGLRLTYDQMVHTHAILNVLGFAVPGLVAWTVAGVPGIQGVPRRVRAGA